MTLKPAADARSLLPMGFAHFSNRRTKPDPVKVPCVLFERFYDVLTHATLWTNELDLVSYR